MNERRTNIAREWSNEPGEMVFRSERRQWLKMRHTELCVNSWGLIATGDLGGYKQGVLRICWERIAELHYGPQSRSAVEGLYAREGEWCSRCVLPGLSETQSDEVVTAIAAIYPRMARTAISALERAVGELQAVKALASKRRWLPSLGRRRIALVVPSARV